MKVKLLKRARKAANSKFRLIQTRTKYEFQETERLYDEFGHDYVFVTKQKFNSKVVAISYYNEAVREFILEYAYNHSPIKVIRP